MLCNRLSCLEVMLRFCYYMCEENPAQRGESWEGISCVLLTAAMPSRHSIHCEIFPAVYDAH